MVELTDVKGVGPAKADTLKEEGYDSVESLADADPDALSSVDGVGEDRALEFIVEAESLLGEEEEEPEEKEQDGFDLTPSELAEEVTEESEEEDDSEDTSEEEPEEEQSSNDEEDAEEEAPTEFEVALSFDTDLQFHTFHAALMRYNENVSHQPATDVMQKCLDGLTEMDGVTYTMTEYELNTLHTAVKQTRTQYQGDNLIPQMDALNEVEEQVNDARREYLF